MNQVQTHIADLKNYTPSNELYGIGKTYFLKVVEKPGLVKLGDTFRDVAERNAETIINASLHIDGEVVWAISEKYDGTTFRDYEFHEFLEDKGYKRELNEKGNKSEWFYITLEQALEEFALFTKKPFYKTYQLRKAQQYVAEQIQDAIDQGYYYINAGLCVRVGKTLLSLDRAKYNNWMPVFIGKNLTSQASARDDNNTYGAVPYMTTVSIHGNDYELDDGDSAIVAKVIKMIDDANEKDQQLVFFVDEVDDASHTQRSRAVIVPVIEHYRKNGKFACIICMSGTRIHRGEKILKDLTDGPIKNIALEYFEMQLLQPDTTVNRNYRHISYYTDSGTLSNISDAFKNVQQGHASIATCLSNLLGTNKFQLKLDPQFPHWFVKFATVGKTNANAFAKFMNRNYSVIENKEYYYSTINGDYTNSDQAQNYCKKIIQDNPNKTCVFISQGMATTSFSVNSIGNSVVFTDNEITSDDIQALHRSATWSEGKTDCNMVVVTTNDSRDLSFADIFEQETRMAETKEEKVTILKTLLDNNSMIHFHEATGFTPVVITEDVAERVIDKKQQAQTKISSIAAMLLEVDDDIQEKIFTVQQGKKATSKKAKGAKGDKYDPFGFGDQTKNNNYSDELSESKKAQIMRAFAENSVLVPALAREQGTTIEEFTYWKELGFNKELFFEVYNSCSQFKERIDTVYGLCEDIEYLLENYIDNLAA